MPHQSPRPSSGEVSATTIDIGTAMMKVATRASSRSMILAASRRRKGAGWYCKADPDLYLDAWMTTDCVAALSPVFEHAMTLQQGDKRSINAGRDLRPTRTTDRSSDRKLSITRIHVRRL